MSKMNTGDLVVRPHIDSNLICTEAKTKFSKINVKQSTIHSTFMDNNFVTINLSTTGPFTHRYIHYIIVALFFSFCVLN